MMLVSTPSTYLGTEEYLMRYRVEGRAKLTWADKATDSLKSKYENITEYIEVEEAPTTERARDLVENLEPYQKYMFQWTTEIKVSRID
jgi:hypothetical protein